ncbi:uncharacterized protein LAESUDRAFT_765089 [Laetiporus sulphureus 93-53]|uniref:DUF6534 domain-containing protein n=1 Tax=Laetiporus sulphureus 93-53 TaxID=1314785 RepID=A0A165AYT4_9APHY|nr:uncharacterized protein LAESUDRAFT_765089 [Laetiporus sulphureus 93-53]KZS99911.1 hypothetical protein LAESUDRAFT_765089 [Laetiporus sulphureus 93-53]
MYKLENGITVLITFIVQGYFAERLWHFSNNNVFVTGGISILAFGALGTGIETTAHLFLHPQAASLSSREVLIVGGCVQGLAALCDILITGSLCYYLHSGRGMIKTTNELIDKLMLYAVNRGGLTSVVQTLFLILNVSLPGRFYWIPFHMAVGKLYVNSLLATLNVRKRLRSTDIELTVPSTIAFKVVQPPNVSSTSTSTHDGSLRAANKPIELVSMDRSNDEEAL